MNEATLILLAREFFQVAIQIAAPLLGAAVLVGVTVSVGQVLTSIQDVTLAYVFRLAGVGLVAAALGRWMVKVLVEYTRELWLNIPHLIG